MVLGSLFTHISSTGEFKASLEIMYNSGFPQCTRNSASISVLIYESSYLIFINETIISLRTALQFSYKVNVTGTFKITRGKSCLP